MPRLSSKLLVISLTLGLAICGQVTLYAQSEGTPAPATTAPPAETESPLLTEPKTADELFRATVLMVDLSRTGLARAYLEQFNKLAPDDDTLLALRDKYGPATFLRLANVKELRPLSTNLLDRMNTVFRKRGADARRVDAMIANLSGTPYERKVAILTLREGGTAVMPRLIQRLGAATTARERDILVESMSQLEPRIAPALIGALDSPNSDLKASVLDVLGWLGNGDTVPYLWYSSFAERQPVGLQQAARRALARILKTTPQGLAARSPSSIPEELRQLATKHFRGKYVWPVGEDRLTEVWRWDAKTNTVFEDRVTPAVASSEAAVRFSRQALQMGPSNQESQSLYLATLLSDAARRNGPERPLPVGPGTPHDLALSSGADLVAAALRTCLKYNNTAGALAAIRVLSQIGARRQIASNDPGRATLIAGLNYPDPRVQFASAVAVMQIDPSTPFAGSDRVVSIFSRALTGTSKRHGLVVHANTQRARDVAGFLNELGYEPLIARTGKEGFKTAAERGDVDLIVLHLSTLDWGISQTVVNLRADARTAFIPIVIYGPQEKRDQLLVSTARYPLISYAVVAPSSRDLKSQIQPLLDDADAMSKPLTAAERGEQMGAAAFWLAHIAHGQRRNIFKLAAAESGLIQALGNPQLASNALRALSAIPTKTAQATLQEESLNARRTADIRESAALLLAGHIQSFGLLLTNQQIRELETGWKAERDTAVASALASVIGTLRPDDSRISERLRQFSELAAPPNGAINPPMKPVQQE